MNEIHNILNDNEKVLWEGKPQFRPFVFSAGAGLLIFVIFSAIFGLLFMAFGSFASDQMTQMSNTASEMEQISPPDGFDGFGDFDDMDIDIDGDTRTFKRVVKTEQVSGFNPASTGIFSIVRYAGLVPVLFALGIMLFAIAYRVLSHKVTHYAITDKRVIIQSGVIGTDFAIVDFDQIANAEVNVGVSDKLFGNNSGSIIITTKGGAVPVHSSNGHTRFAVPHYMLANIDKPYEVFKFFKKVSFDVKTDIHYPNDLRPKGNSGYKSEYKA